MTYTVVGLLGRGGMAVVELAIDADGHHVARKRVSLAGSGAQIDMARRRIRREAEILASLDHPGIVPLLAVEDDGTDVVMVMPRMAASLADRAMTAGPLPPEEVVAMGRVLLDALATAHRQGVIHRDIKPANVLFDQAGRPALADFGVALTRQFTPGLTVDGTIVGTPEFIAPEQARGEQATPASDVFSLGATLAYALTGQGPYGQGEPMAIMGQAARGQVAPLPRSLPPDLRRALTAMLDPRPQRRPSAAAALGGPQGTRVDPVPRRPAFAKQWWKKWPVVAGAALATVLGAVAVGIVVRQSRPPTATAAPPADTKPQAQPTTPPTLPCTPLAYQPCGQPVAAGTDGSSCLPGRADFDTKAANGCEAVSDYIPSTVLTEGQPVLANLVPASAVDSFQADVGQSILDLCLTKFRVTLIAPPGATDKVQIIKGGKVLASAVSSNLQPATASAAKPSCFGDDSGWLTVKVSALSGQSAGDFRLTRSGSW